MLGYSATTSLPAQSEADMCMFVAILRNAVAARNYVGHVKWACQYLGLPLTWVGCSLTMTLQGLQKQHRSERVGCLSTRKLMSEELLLRLLALADGIEMFKPVGDLLLVSWQALLRVQSEAIPLENGSHETVHCLPPSRHSSVFVDSLGNLFIRLKQRKHRPQASMLVRPWPCICTARLRSPLCAGHRLALRCAQMPEGHKLFHFASAIALTQFRKMLKLLQVTELHGFSFKCLRAGKAASLARAGNSLFQVMQSGEWRSAAVLAYADEDEFDKAAFLDIACDSASSSDSES